MIGLARCRLICSGQKGLYYAQSEVHERPENGRYDFHHCPRKHYSSKPLIRSAHEESLPALFLFVVHGDRD